MSNAAKVISIVGIVGILLYALASYFLGIATFETKWILYSWLSFIVFLHLAVGYFSGEIAFGNFSVKRSSTAFGYKICMIFMAFLAVYLGSLAY